MEEKSSNNLNKNDFDWYIEELYKLNSSDPKRANNIARRGLNELGLLDKSKRGNFLGINMENAGVVILCILIVLCVTLVPSPTAIMSYIFGCVFFFAGLFIGLKETGVGLIFLCSHGGIGLIIMLVSLLGAFSNTELEIEELLHNPALTDGGMQSNLYMYLYLIGAVFVTALVYTILHNLSPKLKENKIHKMIILALNLVGILLVGLLPRIFG